MMERMNALEWGENILGFGDDSRLSGLCSSMLLVRGGRKEGRKEGRK